MESKALVKSTNSLTAQFPDLKIDKGGVRELSVMRLTIQAVVSAFLESCLHAPARMRPTKHLYKGPFPFIFEKTLLPCSLIAISIDMTIKPEYKTDTVLYSTCACGGVNPGRVGPASR